MAPPAGGRKTSDSGMGPQFRFVFQLPILDLGDLRSISSMSLASSLDRSGRWGCQIDGRARDGPRSHGMTPSRSLNVPPMAMAQHPHVALMRTSSTIWCAYTSRIVPDRYARRSRPRRRRPASGILGLDLSLPAFGGRRDSTDAEICDILSFFLVRAGCWCVYNNDEETELPHERAKRCELTTETATRRKEKRGCLPSPARKGTSQRPRITERQFVTSAT